MSENGEIYTAGKNFTLPSALTAWTNSTSEMNNRNEQWVESLVGDEGATTNAAGTPTLYSDNPGKKYVIAEKDVSYELWQM